jgi:hypothetical protein
MIQKNSLMTSIYRMPMHDIPKMSMTDKCIVLDLDQTLIATQEDVESLYDLKILTSPKYISLRSRIYHIRLEDLEKPGVGSKYDFWGITRPNIDEFLLFCFSYFRIVAVWSAGKKPYVEAIVDHIFKDLPQPHIVFTHDDIDYDAEKNILKKLTKLIDYNSLTRENITLDNTFALDDNPTTFRNNPANGILIPAYEPECTIESFLQKDDDLLKFKHWLLSPEVMYSTSVSQLNTSDIFN